MTTDDRGAAVDALDSLGLSQYEAQVFIALQQLRTGTASDVDRITDVPRSQVYGAAERLEERGLIDVQQSNPMQYRAVALSEARSVLRERFERDVERAFSYLERTRGSRGSDEGEQQEGVWTIRGRENVSQRVQQLIAGAETRVLYLTSAELLDDDVVETLAERAGSIETWVFSADDAAIEALSEVPDLSVGRFPEHEGGEMGGRLLAVDGDTVLLSVPASAELPGEHDETAIWSAGTGFAAVLLQLVGSHLDEEVGQKV
jgi:sugar-specific transcriptional regulator TrmB